MPVPAIHEHGRVQQEQILQIERLLLVLLVEANHEGLDVVEAASSATPPVSAVAVGAGVPLQVRAEADCWVKCVYLSLCCNAIRDVFM